MPNIQSETHIYLLLFLLPDLSAIGHSTAVTFGIIVGVDLSCTARIVIVQAIISGRIGSAVRRRAFATGPDHLPDRDRLSDARRSFSGEASRRRITSIHGRFARGHRAGGNRYWITSGVSIEICGLFDFPYKAWFSKLGSRVQNLDLQEACRDPGPLPAFRHLHLIRILRFSMPGDGRATPGSS